MRVVHDGHASYKCDNCKRNLSEENAAHYSLNIAADSGINGMTATLPGFRWLRLLHPKRIHLCLQSDRPDCVPSFFNMLEKSGNPFYTEG